MPPPRFIFTRPLLDDWRDAADGGGHLGLANVAFAWKRALKRSSLRQPFGIEGRADFNGRIFEASPRVSRNASTTYIQAQLANFSARAISLLLLLLAFSHFALPLSSLLHLFSNNGDLIRKTRARAH